MTSWADKRVLITGGSSGVGMATAELLAARGAHVAIVGRDRERLEAAREAVAVARASEGQKALAYAGDVSDWDQMNDVAKRAEADLGGIDLLAACAGFCTPGRFTELAVEEFAAHVDTNLLGVIYAARAVAPGMMARRSGHIAMVSSMGGLVGVYGYSAYSAAKFGVTGFAEVLRAEMKPHGVRVSLLCPPNMETPGYARELELEPPETAAINGMAKALPPEVVARQFVRGIERGRFLILSGLSNKLLYRIEGVWPELFFGIFDSNVRSVQRKEARHAH
jgi:3-dehydrosphinganine reductase